ncbi:MAG: hypothetical protein ACKVP7_17180 [Hyphomicrobiaceae bacterium]
MRLVDYTLKLLGITEAMRRLQGVFGEVDEKRRDKIAKFSEEIAGTLARAAEAYERLEKDPADKTAARVAIREFGRLNGYVENILVTLDGRVDGRRLAGIKRRLEGLALEGLMTDSVKRADSARIERLVAAEGYFRALADGLRA